MRYQDNHLFQGLRQDNFPIRQKSEFLWEAHNVRLTARDGNTMLSITNERSTESLLNFSKAQYIGHSVIGNYLIVFVKEDEDYIYRVNLDELNKNTNLPPTILYKGNLNFNKEFPIQAISDYESKLVQKVYWTDGLNPPRLINVVKPELRYTNPSEHYDINKGYSDIYKDAPFNFIQELTLEEEVSIVKTLGAGLFPAGTVQYVCTYYNKYQQETNPFYVSELLYTSHQDRAGSPDEKVHNSFNIEIKKPDTKFDFLRIYSIVRTSLDSTPTCKRIVDIDLSKVTKEDTISYLDNNLSGDIIDPQSLLYKGGNNIIADTILAKDNTLFFGNIKYDRPSLSNFTINNAPLTDHYINDKTDNIIGGAYRKVLLPTDAENRWNNQLNLGNTSTFKYGQTYRFGLQFQYKTGEWSEPIYINDFKNPNKASIVKEDDKTYLKLPTMLHKVCPLMCDILIEQGFKKVRPLIVLPSVNDYDILCQGIINPTVFNIQSRNNNAPFVQASWNIRPFNGRHMTEGPIQGLQVAEFRHLFPVKDEIQNTVFCLDSFDTEDITEPFYPTLEDVYHEKNKDNKKDIRGDEFKTPFFVDQSILTLNSPDIEFNDAIINNINGDYTINLVGFGGISQNVFSSKIETSSPTAGADSEGVKETTLISNNGEHNNNYYLGYNDLILDDVDDNKVVPLNYYNDVNWCVYTWHRQGSLNNDINRQDDTTRTGVLKKKVFAQYKYIDTIIPLETPIELSKDKISQIQLFNSNEVSLLKIPKDKESDIYLNYYGNVDTLLSSNIPYSSFFETNAKAVMQIPTNGDYVNFALALTDGTRGTFKVVGDYSSSFITLEGIVVSHKSKLVNFYNVPLKLQNSDTDKYIHVTLQAKYEGDSDAAIDSVLTVTSLTVLPSSEIELSTSTGTIFGNNPKITMKESKDIITSIAYSRQQVGNKESGKGLKHPKEPVRMKYKSTPHLVFALQHDTFERKLTEEEKKEGVSPFLDYRWPLPTLVDYSIPANIIDKQNWIEGDIKAKELELKSIIGGTSIPATLYIAEVCNNINKDKQFGGTSPEALQDNMWIPAGKAVPLVKDKATVIEWLWGDTWYQRFDCLKTYPFTQEDINQVVEIVSFMCESRVNLDGRYDRNRGLLDNTNVSPINFNKINTVYSQKNNFFTYRIFDKDYYKVTQFPNQILWSTVKNPDSEIDAYTNLTLASSLNLDGTKGKVTSINSINDIIITFQEKATSRILFNSRVQIQTSDGVPIEIANSQKVEGTRYISDTIGCQDKFSAVTSPLGVYFIDSNSDSIYIVADSIINLGNKLGNMYWARNNHSDSTWKPFNTDYNNGIRLYYNPKFNEIYFNPGLDNNSNRNTLCYSEEIGQFTSTFDYNGAAMFNYNADLYSLALDSVGNLTLWKHESGNGYNSLFGTTRPFYISFISNDTPMESKIFDTVELRSDLFKDNVLSNNNSHLNQIEKPFNYIQVTNEYQDTGVVELTSSRMRKKLRTWRISIPRNKDSRHRIVNNWAKITLGRDNKDGRVIGNDLTILHDLDVNYTI